jgi:tripartite-type tricarboxylate transporter receptor subunit TctC
MKFLLLLIVFLYTNAFSQTAVQVIWPFSLAANQANVIRTLIDNANNNQSKYHFILINKPGAGGLIAANATLTSTKPTIFANTSSFYITPLLSKDSYDVDHFAILSRMCVDRPLVLFSKNITKLGQDEITISVTPNTIQSLLPRVVQNSMETFRYREVPFKVGTDGTLAMLGGIVDASVDWLGSSASIITPNNGVKIVGITGKKYINNLPLLPGTENLTADIFLFLPKTADAKLNKEFHQIFQEALNEKTESFCKNDFGRQVETDFNTIDKLHLYNKHKWKKLTSGVTPQ